MQTFHTKVEKTGRILIPAKLRRELHFNPGDDLILTHNGTLTVMHSDQALSHAQQLVRKYVGPERSLSRELIEERRESATHE